MTTNLDISELEGAAGRDLGAGEWHEIGQERVNLFADATDDHQWIHLDPVAAAAGPFGATVAHGYLTLSLIPALLPEILVIEGASIAVNYGIERVRFPAPVRVGSRVRLKASLGRVEPRSFGIAYHVEVTVEIEGEAKPGLVGEVIFLAA